MRIEHVALKGTREGLVLYLDPTAEFSSLMEELAQHLKKSAQFLQGASVSCYAGEKEMEEKQRTALDGLLKEHGLEISRWLTTEEIGLTAKSPVVREEEQMAQTWDEGIVEGSCLFVDRTLRSGQKVEYSGHVIVLGDVNPGAEIFAGGNVFVLGALRGVAHAGAIGDRKATVSAISLMPTQLRIADLVTRPPEDTDEGRGPEIARIKDDRLIVETLVIGGRRGKGALR